MNILMGFMKSRVWAKQTIIRQICSLGQNTTRRNHIIGHGYIFRPKDLPAYMYNKPWWAPPHAHNAVVNAGFAGGIGATVLAAIIFIGVGYGALTMDRSASEKVPMAAIYIQLTVHAMLTPLLNSSFKAQGIIFLLLMRYLTVTAPKQIRIGEMHRRIKNTRFNWS